MWIIDLLIDKLKKEKEWSPEPLYIELDYDDRNINESEEKEEDKRVIIIDI